MGTTPHRHHIVPQFYLRGFTDSGDKTGKFWVIDLNSDTQPRLSKPINEAHRRDYYRVDTSDLDQDFIESRLLNTAESLAAPVVTRIARCRTLPEEDEEFGFLVWFVASMALRTDSFRQRMAAFLQSDSKAYLRSITADPHRFEETLQHMREHGYGKSIDITYEDMRQFIEEDDYWIRVPKERLIHQFLLMLEPLVRDLYALQWSLVIAYNGAGHFICSDNPVSIFPTVRVPEPRSGSLLQCRPQIHFPLNNDLALFISDEHLPPVLMADCSKVALFNTNTADVATRHLYSRNPDFIWRRDDGTLGNSFEYMIVHPGRAVLCDGAASQ